MVYLHPRHLSRGSQVGTEIREGAGRRAHPLVRDLHVTSGSSQVRDVALMSRADRAWLVSDRFSDSSRLDDVDRLAATLGAKLHRTCDECEEGVIATTANAVAGVEVRATLADDDLAGVDGLAAEALDAKKLRVRVAPVARRRCTLFVCHVSACLWFWGLSDERTTGRKRLRPRSR